MLVLERNTGQGADLPSKPFVNVCPSSWVSWACYGFGLFLALTPEAANDLAAGGTGFTVLAGSIFMFFLSVALIQRHMRLSLLSNSFGRPDRLIMTGVFGVSRNPIYAAFLIPLGGIGVYSLSAAFVASATYIAAITALVIRREEADLSRRFGAEYAAYAARTPRWIGF